MFPSFSYCFLQSNRKNSTNFRIPGGGRGERTNSSHLSPRNLYFCTCYSYLTTPVGGVGREGHTTCSTPSGPLQVASHVQKYFIKLAKAGLPVPGRMPNMAAYASKSKKVWIISPTLRVGHTTFGSRRGGGTGNRGKFPPSLNISPLASIRSY